MPKRSWWLAAGSLLLLGYTAFHYVHGAFLYRGYDDYYFEIEFVRKWLATGAFNSEYVYLYPPLYYLLSVPLAQISNTAGALVMVVLNQALFVVCLGLLAMAMTPRPSRRIWLWLLLPLALNFRPLLYLFSMAKIEMIQMTLLVGALVALQRNRSWLAGGLTAFSGMMKPLPLLLLLHFLWKRDWRAVKGWTVVSGAILAVSCAVFGIGAVWNYFYHVAWPKGGNFGPLSWYENQSLLGLAIHMVHPVHPDVFFVPPEEIGRADVVLGMALRLGCLGWLGYLLRPRQGSSRIRVGGEWSLAVTGMLLLSPFSRDYYAAFLLPAYLLLTAHLAQHKRPWQSPACWLGALSYLLVGQGFPLSMIRKLPSVLPGVDNFHMYLHYGGPTFGYLLLMVAWAKVLREENTAEEEHAAPILVEATYA